ncbi:MAG TPA: hypothetical protein VM869_19355 [Enhygromyxa sp.]|nr:hypothetical protein [Enhygromyxa sp.]
MIRVDLSSDEAGLLWRLVIGCGFLQHLTYLTADEITEILGNEREAATAVQALGRLRFAYKVRDHTDPAELPERTSSFEWVDPLHPDGRCTCAGEGRCTWCTGLFPCGHKRAECPGCGDGESESNE